MIWTARLPLRSEHLAIHHFLSLSVRQQFHLNAFYSSQLLLVSHACLILKFVMVTKISLSGVLNKYMYM